MEIKQIEDLILKDLESFEEDNEKSVNSLKLWVRFALNRKLKRDKVDNVYHRHQAALKSLIEEDFLEKTGASRNLSDCDVRLTHKGRIRLDTINRNPVKKLLYYFQPQLKDQVIALIFLIIVSTVSFIFGQNFRQLTKDNSIKQQSEINIPSPSKGFQTYSLDMSNIENVNPARPRVGLYVIHNGVAVFPIDLRNQVKKITEKGPTTIQELGSKAGCSDQPNVDSIKYHTTEEAQKYGGLMVFDPPAPIHVANLRKITLTMPYYESHPDYDPLKPGVFCVGFHSKGKMIWDATPITPIYDDVRKEAYGEVMLDAKEVDAIALLFNSVSLIKAISFEAERTK